MRYFLLILRHRPRSGDCNTTLYLYPYRVLTYTLSPYTVTPQILGNCLISRQVSSGHQRKNRESGCLPEEDTRKIRTIEKVLNKLPGVTATVKPVH